MPIYNVTKKKLFIFSLILVLGLLLLSLSIKADNLEVKYPQIGGNSINNSSSFPQYIAYIAKFSIWLSLALVFAVFAIASVRYITSIGNPPTMKDAKDQIISSLIGLAIVLSSYVILYTVNPDLVKLKFNNATISSVPTIPVASTSLASIHNYNVIPVGQLIKDGIYGHHAMITASTTLNILPKIIKRPGGIDLAALLSAAKGQIGNFDTDKCMNQCYQYTQGCYPCYSLDNPPDWLCGPGSSCSLLCGANCSDQQWDFSSLLSNFRSLELIEEIDKMIADTAAQCKCESPNPNCCQCHGSLCNSCCDDETGSCGPTSSDMTAKCATQPVGCPDAHCDTTTIKILSHFLGAAIGNTSPYVEELDKLRVHGAIDPQYPKYPLHTTKRFENGPANIMKGLLQAQDIISGYDAANYNSALGLIESYGPENVSTTPLDAWMKRFWLENKSDPLSFYINAGSYDPDYIPPYNPINPPIKTGNCSKYNGKETNDKGINMTFFCQCSDPWGSEPIGSESCQSQTMCKYGCLVTSLDMLFHYYHIPGMDNPDKALQTFKDNNCIVKDDNCGFTNGNIIWSNLQAYLEKQNYLLEAPTVASLPDLETTYFQNNIPVLASCTNFNGTSLHYIILRGYDGSTVYISDPGWGNTQITKQQYDNFRCAPINILHKK